MKAAILTVGDEILIGQIVDTNSAWLGQELSDIGIKINTIVSVGDNHDQIIDAIDSALADNDIIIMTGGLGPTKDDITKKAIADCLGVGMYFDQLTFDRIKGMFERLGRELSPHHHDQCLMPEGVKLLRNSMGTAPGMWLEKNGKPIISMPGVPYEMKAIMTQEVLPIFKEKYVDQYIEHRTILTACTGETTIENKIQSIIDEMPDHFKVAYLPGIAAVRVRLTAQGKDSNAIRQNIALYGDKIKSALGDIVYGEGESSLEKEILASCISKKLTVGLAESCTGGAIAHRLIGASGSSAYFMGSIVAYDNDVKKNLLHVPQEEIEQFGAVSEEVAISMAKGCLQTLKTDLAVSVTGIAGPDGGSEYKPVGTIWICVASKEKHITFLLKSGKDRSKNIEGAVIYALDLLRKFIG